jgi:hypothetical protein
MKHLLKDSPRQQNARILFPSIIVACIGMVLGSARALPIDTTVGPEPPLYSVVNLGIPAGTAILNERGQVAFSNSNAANPIHAFFDGKRRYDIIAPGGRYVNVRGLNDLGVVVGDFDDASTQPPFNLRAFKWTVGGGIRALTGPGTATAIAINDRNQAVGSIHGSASYTRAIRWNPDGTQTNLGPIPASFSEATAINYSSVAVGVADVALDGSHATVWDAAGSATDLGKFGGVESVADFVNANSQVVGRYFTQGGGLGGTNTGGFFWSRQGGSVKIVAFGWNDLTIEALNDAGQVAGNRMYPPGDLTQTTTPFIWCLQTGARLLPFGSAANSRVLALNNRAEMVGFIQLAQSQQATRRAVRWNGVSAPVDLNTRLYRAPAGLVLTSAKAINDHGTILAESNAGLVLLIPGKAKSAAPVLGPVTRTTAGDTVALNSVTDFTAGFVGSDAAKTHTAAATVDDGCPQTAPSLREVRGQGDVSVRHTFCKPGSFKVKITVTDGTGNTAEVQSLQFVSDPAVATLMGQGTLSNHSKQPARTGERPLQLTLWAPLASNGAGNTAPTSRGFINASGPFHFHADVAGSSVRNGQSVQLSGTGSLNGLAGYRYTLDAGTDGGRAGSANSLRLRISHQGAGSHGEVIDYDNASSTADTASLASASAAARTLDVPARTPLVEGSVWLVGGEPAR